MNALVSVVAVVGTLIALEGAIRLWVVIAPPTHGGFASRMWRQRFVALNHDGMRDLNHTVQPSPCTERALVVGDSYAFGWGVKKPEDRFGEQLLQRLGSDGTRWEGLNFSASDRHTLRSSFSSKG